MVLDFSDYVNKNIIIRLQQPNGSNRRMVYPRTSFHRFRGSRASITHRSHQMIAQVHKFNQVSNLVFFICWLPHYLVILRIGWTIISGPWLEAKNERIHILVRLVFQSDLAGVWSGGSTTEYSKYNLYSIVEPKQQFIFRVLPKVPFFIWILGCRFRHWIIHNCLLLFKDMLLTWHIL